MRSFAIQGSWNYRTLIGTGFAFALLPVLRVVYRDDRTGLEEAVARHSSLFNSHPYLAPIALGAVSTMTEAGEDVLVIERFKAAVRGSLGTLGDRLVWAGWRPVCMLVALALLALGTPWWFAVAAFLVVYNVGHLVLRLWGYGLGLSKGKGVGERLRRYPVGPLQQGLMAMGAFLTGLVLPLALSGGLGFVGGVWPPEGADIGMIWGLVAGMGAVAGVRFGLALRTPLVLGLVVYVAVGILMELGA